MIFRGIGFQPVEYPGLQSGNDRLEASHTTFFDGLSVESNDGRWRCVMNSIDEGIPAPPVQAAPWAARCACRLSGSGGSPDIPAEFPVIWTPEVRKLRPAKPLSSGTCHP